MVSFFDFIVAANGGGVLFLFYYILFYFHFIIKQILIKSIYMYLLLLLEPLRDVDGSFIDLIKASENKALPLTLYNIKNHSIREIQLVPSRNWSGEGICYFTYLLFYIFVI
jgi:hypothetical protein